MAIPGEVAAWAERVAVEVARARVAVAVVVEDAAAGDLPRTSVNCQKRLQLLRSDMGKEDRVRVSVCAV